MAITTADVLNSAKKLTENCETGDYIFVTSKSQLT